MPVAPMLLPSLLWLVPSMPLPLLLATAACDLQHNTNGTLKRQAARQTRSRARLMGAGRGARTRGRHAAAAKKKPRTYNGATEAAGTGKGTCLVVGPC